MTITIDLTADLEARLLQEAAKQGIDPEQYIVQAMRSRLQKQELSAPRLDPQQSALLEQINQGLSQTEWDLYYALVAKRQAGTLSENDYAELTAMGVRIEELNTRRLELLVELARLQGVSLPELLGELGIAPPPVI
jgi:hypothetical protein